MLKMKTVWLDGHADWQLTVCCDECGGEIGVGGGMYAWEVQRIGAVLSDGTLSRSAFDVVDGNVRFLHRLCTPAWEGAHGGSDRWIATDIRALAVDVGSTIGLRVVVEGWNE